LVVSDRDFLTAFHQCPLVDSMYAALAWLKTHRYRLPELSDENLSTRAGGVQDLNEAFRMLDTFASVGATRFDLTHIDIEGEKRGFRPQQSIQQLNNSLPKLFPGATARQNNIIVRPYGDNVQLIQLDDLKSEALTRVRDVAFLILQTSPGNHQAWVAVSDLKTAEETKEFARRLRKGAGADPSASGATRIAGTVNYKPKYEPDFPRVKIIDSVPGRIAAWRISSGA
jgi:hypothetical protein